MNREVGYMLLASFVSRDVLIVGLLLLFIGLLMFLLISARYERRKSEREAYGHLASLSPQSIIVLNEQLSVKYISQSVYDYCEGRNPKELLTKEQQFCMVGEDYDLFEKMAYAVLQTGASKVIVCRLTVRDQVSTVEIFMKRFSQPHNTVTRELVCSIKDITERIDYENELRQLAFGERAEGVAEGKADIDWALRRGELFLVYQPKVSLHDGRTIGTEALMRWRHPQRGLISPNEFIPEAERRGAIEEMTYWAIEKAVTDMKPVLQDMPHFYTAVNLSAQMFNDPGLVAKILCILQRVNFPPDRLVLEITETGIMNNLALCREMLQELMNHGVRIAMDDFGKGYSSLDSLRQLPVAILKIDKNFVDRLEDEKDLIIVKAVIRLAKELNIKVLAEGIETKKQWQQLAALQCDYGQGYYFGKPHATISL
ncbi:PAS/PAC sensor-containing diguanylate cyclase/phosphodiesterase [Fictibacillus macauensis ZFHKF-1]|uniref:PAS/PAC sensor-containing diguanylate cyclase/phosphodiesterase n=1 Tax=Fictibacillus macauensis ZFHKF-1 TaxID=1196324 RepID=I8J3C5_9BACL|nr:EAL domain-containing protein [Fictibacillus macauensis]EIT86271.1 PAS/PAC sensor-containing diguanylate cyclase/phosphodiesterase [Fictibacillus macauensis ZFHKF-1]